MSGPRAVQTMRPHPNCFIPASTYSCLIISFEHVADTPPVGRIVLDQTSEVTRVVTVVDQFVHVLGLTLEDAGTDQGVPLLSSPWLGFTSQSGGRDAKPDLLGSRLLVGGLCAAPSHFGHHPRQHGHGGQRVHRQGAHQLEPEVHPDLRRERMFLRCECYGFHPARGLETQ